MSRKEDVFVSLAYSPFLETAVLIANRFKIPGVGVAVAVGEYPDEENDLTLPHVAMTVSGENLELHRDMQDRLFDRVGDIIQDMASYDYEMFFDVNEHPGMLFSVESNQRKYAYILVVLEFPKDVGDVDLDETMLVRDVVSLINNELPYFTDKDEDDSSQYNKAFTCESDPVVRTVYGTLSNPAMIHSYTINYKYVAEDDCAEEEE